MTVAEKFKKNFGTPDRTVKHLGKTYYVKDRAWLRHVEYGFITEAKESIDGQELTVNDGTFKVIGAWGGIIPEGVRIGDTINKSGEIVCRN